MNAGPKHPALELGDVTSLRPDSNVKLLFKKVLNVTRPALLTIVVNVVHLVTWSVNLYARLRTKTCCGAIPVHIAVQRVRNALLFHQVSLRRIPFIQ